MYTRHSGTISSLTAILRPRRGRKPYVQVITVPPPVLGLNFQYPRAPQTSSRRMFVKPLTSYSKYHGGCDAVICSYAAVPSLSCGLRDRPTAFLGPF
jgi:hypothetical protein